MRLYIKGNYAKKISFTTRELVWKMWFKEWHGHPITYSNVGDDEMLQDDFFFGVQFDKWRFNDKRWDHIPYDKAIHGIRILMKIFSWNLKMILLLMGENVEKILGLLRHIRTF